MGFIRKIKTKNALRTARAFGVLILYFTSRAAASRARS